MHDEHWEDHLSRISTMWTMVCNAHGENTSEINVAQNRIIERYSGAVYRYLLAVLRNQDAADEVFQEFALKLATGGFRNADQTRGRFRDYVKVAILRLVTDYRRKQQRGERGRVADEGNLELVGEDATPDKEAEEAFTESCRNEFLGRAWRALKAVETQSGQLLFTVLDYRAHHPDAPSHEIADQLNQKLRPGKPLSAAGVRKTLERARLRFADLLLDEVSQSLNAADPTELEQELIDLGLHGYCAQAWQRRYGKNA